MNSFNKKQKIILGVIAGMIICAICYYVYAKDDNYLEYTNEENSIEQTNEKNTNDTNTNKEEYSDSRIIVHITGAVNKEGVIELKAKSRISDAIDKAGGIKEDANLEKINLAFVLEDGMKVYIPSINDKEEVVENSTNSKEETNQNTDETSKYIGVSSGVSSIETEATKTGNSSQNIKVNINKATQTELETLPGIGPSIALKIINYRNEKGKFSNIEEIKEVSGIGEAKFGNIKDLITIN